MPRRTGGSEEPGAVLARHPEECRDQRATSRLYSPRGVALRRVGSRLHGHGSELPQPAYRTVLHRSLSLASASHTEVRDPKKGEPFERLASEPGSPCRPRSTARQTEDLAGGWRGTRLDPGVESHPGAQSPEGLSVGSADSGSRTWAEANSCAVECSGASTAQLLIGFNCQFGFWFLRSHPG
jgi:hypothetical protein